MPEASDAEGPATAKPAASKPTSKPPQTFTSKLQKRWRAWLRALHRDIGYLAVGFTVLYSLSGIAMNHIDDWDPNFHAQERTLKIAPLPDGLSDADAVKRIGDATGLSGKIDDVYRAGDEVRVTYTGGSKVTAIGDTVTVQIRRDRFFFRVADWLHATRGKQAWKFIADLYAGLLFYLAISGIFMIKGKLGLRWRGGSLIALGLLAPIGYIVLSGGPGAQSTERVASRPGEAEVPADDKASTKPANDGVKPLPPDDDDKPAAPKAAGSAAPAKRDDGVTPLPSDDH